MKKRVYRFIFFDLMRWKFEGVFPAEIKKCVIIVMPHTSWHDFYIGLFSRGILGLEMHWVGKKELFKFPFGRWFRWMGGAPIDRSGGLNKVDSIVQIFTQRSVLRLAISPEGTRKKVTELKTGFYYIALKAGVPIVPVVFDYAKKRVKFGAPLQPTGNYAADMQLILPFYSGAAGKIKKFSYEIP